MEEKFDFCGWATKNNLKCSDGRIIRIDENGRFKETIDSELNKCLNLEANIDQTGRALIQDAVMSMLDEGCIAMVPTETTENPEITKSYDILSMRVGKQILLICETWSPIATDFGINF